MQTEMLGNTWGRREEILKWTHPRGWWHAPRPELQQRTWSRVLWICEQSQHDLRSITELAPKDPTLLRKRQMTGDRSQNFCLKAQRYWGSDRWQGSCALIDRPSANDRTLLCDRSHTRVMLIFSCFLIIKPP